MERVAQFEKVTWEQFQKDFQVSDFAENGPCLAAYEAVTLPVRATKGSAGYDFRAPAGFALEAGQSISVPTGIRCKITEGYVLSIYPRSGFGFRYRLQLDNTIGIIDSDYYDSDNEGHIFIKITNDSKEGKAVTIDTGTAFAQGIFIAYGLTVDDAADGIRNGGLGSTSNKRL